MDVKGMLNGISFRTFQKWMWFAEKEPFDREVYQLAHVAQVLANVNRDTKKHPNPFPLSDFIIKFRTETEKGKAAPVEKPKPRETQSLEYMDLIITSWIGGHNALVAAEEAKKGRKKRSA